MAEEAFLEPRKSTQVQASHRHPIDATTVVFVLPLQKDPEIVADPSQLKLKSKDRRSHGSRFSSVHEPECENYIKFLKGWNL